MTSVLPYKRCPVCRDEYTHAATRCLDCDVPLVSAEELEQLEQQVVDFPPAAELACVRVAPIAWIRALSEALREGGAAHRVEPAEASDAPEGQRPEVFGNVQLFGLYVRSEDAASATELDSGIAARLLPDEAPALADGEHDACPACGTALGADETTCPDCGLGFG